MNRKIVTKKSFAFRVLVLSAALTWVAADVALAGQGSAGSSRSSNRPSSSSGSSSTASSPSSGGSGSSGRSAVSRGSSNSPSSAPSRGSARAGVQTRSGSGAASTRTGQRPQPGHGGGGGHYGGYYGGYYSSYYGVPYYWSPWGYWGWGLTFGSGYGAYGHGYGHYPPVAYSSRRGYQMGALDLSVRPKNTEVYVDGQYVGLAKQYDGFPGHLWLESGVYEVGFYGPGFETQTRTVKIMTDLVLDLEIDMQSGVAVKPEMRFGPEGLEREELERESADDLAQWDRQDRRDRRDRRSPGGDFQARLHLAVEPPQALVYLDGNVLGTGSELAGLHAGLILSAGTHTLEVVHRGFVTVERLIDVESGEEVEFQLTLKPAADSASP